MPIRLNHAVAYVVKAVKSAAGVVPVWSREFVTGWKNTSPEVSQAEAK
jgi:hypothetical protein